MLQTGSQLGLASGLSLSTSSEAPRRLHNAPADPYVSHETERMKVGLESLQADAGKFDTLLHAIRPGHNRHIRPHAGVT
jgi:hypothetical protein